MCCLKQASACLCSGSQALKLFNTKIKRTIPKAADILGYAASCGAQNRWSLLLFANDFDRYAPPPQNSAYRFCKKQKAQRFVVASVPLKATLFGGHFFPVSSTGCGRVHSPKQETCFVSSKLIEKVYLLETKNTEQSKDYSVFWSE